MRPAPPRLSGALGVDPTLQAAEDEQQDEASDIDPQPVVPRASRKARTGKVPKSVDDLDVKSDPLLKDFVAKYDVKTGFEKYLIIALWLRDTRQIDTFTVDHIYTCFKLLGWSTNSADFSKPLRNCADNGWLKGDSKGFALTLTGAGKVEDKLRKAE
jgi:hypothetical protein